MNSRDSELRGNLLAAKATALSRRLGADSLDIRKAPGGIGGLAASDDGAMIGYLVVDGGADEIRRRRSTGDSSSIRSLGPALIWARSVGVDRLNLFVDSGASDLARRARFFGDLVRVYAVEGAEPVLAEPAGLDPAPELPDSVTAWADLIRRCGATPVDDFGRLVAEVNGLEVGRVELGDDGKVVLEVGVGEADRLLYSMVHTELDTEASLRRAVDMVAETRVAGPVRHPLQRLARERWLRAILVADPALAGATELWPVPPLRPRETLVGSQPAAAVGTGANGDPVVVVASVGIDPDLVPEAADYRGLHSPEARLVLVVSERDRLAPIDDLASLVRDCGFVSPILPWES